MERSSRLATQTCWQCFARLRISSGVLPVTRGSSSILASSTPSAAAAFSTSHPGYLPSGFNDAAAHRVKRTTRMKRKKREIVKKPPAPGERRALQKRIVLSNTNALEVREIDDFEAHTASQTENVGHLFAIPGNTLDQLREIQAFRTTQGWQYFRRPTVLVRKETAELGSLMDQQQSKSSKPARRIITGDLNSGKSVLLLQAQVMAFLKGWVVIHLPEGQDLTNAHTAYSPLKTSEPEGATKYAQRKYVSELLSRTVKANREVLSGLTLSQTHKLSVPVQDGITLAQFGELGARDPDLAWPVFQGLWAELTSTSAAQKRPPVLLTLDGLAHISGLSEYLSPSMHHIHAFDLALIDHFVAHLTGALPLPNGGAVLAADSFSNRPTAPFLDLAIQQSEAAARAGSSTHDLPLFDPENPFAAADARVLAAMRSVDVMRIPGLSKDEARAMLEYYAKSGLLREKVTQHLVNEKWLLAGGGVIGELERSTILKPI